MLQSCNVFAGSSNVLLCPTLWEPCLIRAGTLHLALMRWNISDANSIWEGLDDIVLYPVPIKLLQPFLSVPAANQTELSTRRRSRIFSLMS